MHDFILTICISNFLLSLRSTYWSQTRLLFIHGRARIVRIFDYLPIYLHQFGSESMNRRDPTLRRAEIETLCHVVSSIRLRVRKPYRLRGDCRCTVTRLALLKQRSTLTNIETRPLPSKRKNRYSSDRERRTL